MMSAYRKCQSSTVDKDSQLDS